MQPPHAKSFTLLHATGRHGSGRDVDENVRQSAAASGSHPAPRRGHSGAPDQPGEDHDPADHSSSSFGAQDSTLGTAGADHSTRGAEDTSSSVSLSLAIQRGGPRRDDRSPLKFATTPRLEHLVHSGEGKWERLRAKGHLSREEREEWELSTVKSR